MTAGNLVSPSSASSPSKAILFLMMALNAKAPGSTQFSSLLLYHSARLSKPHILARPFPRGSAHIIILVCHPFASASLQLKNHFRRESFPSGAHTHDLLVHLSVCTAIVWLWTYHNHIFMCMNTISFRAVNFVVASTWWIRFFAELSTQPSCLSPVGRGVE